jgi:alpha-glucosidase
MADPDWWRQSVVYQIYPRSFADADGDGTGDLRGILSRVDYLVSLGIDAVWLSPFYPSPLVDGGYDVADYRNVDQRLGTLEDFDEIVDALHAKSVRVIVDIVPNHSSDQHPWFKDALAAQKGSPERDRYLFRDGKGESGSQPPSDWVSHFGGSAWTRITEPDGSDGQWYLHLFSSGQPDWNWDNEDVREDFHRTLRFWADRGVDGFRVDVANLLAKDMSEPLRSKPTVSDDLTQVDGTDPIIDRDEVHEIYERWRDVFNEYDPPRTAVAEAWVPVKRRATYARPTELGQAFNFDLLLADWSDDQFRSVIQSNLTQVQQSGSSSTWVLSNHDVVRHASRYGLPAKQDFAHWLLSNGTDPVADRERGLRRARAATMLMFALPGSAYIYQGEELGLFEVADIPPSDLEDPIWRRSDHTRKGRDGCRVPLPWTVDPPSFGFGSAKPHLPQPDWFAEHSVQLQDATDGSTLQMYRQALAARRELVRDESLEWFDDQDGVIHFIRAGSWHSVTNFSTEAVDLPDGRVVVCSGELDAGKLPSDTTAWVVGEHTVH